MSLSDLSIRRPILATVMTITLVVLGSVSVFRLNIDEYPNMTYPYVTVQISYNGAQPEQIDNQITKKVEEAVGEAKGARHITSTSKEGIAEIGIEFGLDTNAGDAAQDIRDKVNAIRGELPTGIEEPVISRFDMNAAPVAAIALTSDILSTRELSIVVDDILKPALQKVSGIGKLSIMGNEEREIRLLLRPESLCAFNLSPLEISNQISKETSDIAGGNLDNGVNTLPVTTHTVIRTPADFENIAIAMRNNTPIYFRQIGEIKDTIKTPTSIARYDNHPAIGIEIGKQSGANTVVVAKEVRAVLDSISSKLPKGVHLQLVRDDASRIQEAINDVAIDLILGSLIATFIVFVFLGDIRTTLISAITLPTTIVATFFCIYMAGFTINTMSMLGLSLAIGLLIDDAIVIVENIIRHRQLGESPSLAASLGTKEITLAVVATTLSVIAVFLPMGFMTSITGQLFKEFGLTITFAVILSLFISFTLTPMLASKFIKEGIVGNSQIFIYQQRFSHWFDNLSEKYGQLLTKVLHTYRLAIISGALAVFAMSLGLLNIIGSDMMPGTDKSQFTIKYQLQNGTNLESMDQLTQNMTKIVMDIPSVRHVYATNSVGEEQALFVQLAPKDERSATQNEIIDKVREQLNQIPGVKIWVEGLSDMGDMPISISITGNDLNSLGDASDQIVTLMETMSGVIDIKSTYRPGSPRLSIVPNKRAVDLNVATDDIGNTIGLLLDGKKSGKFNDSEEQVDVRVLLDASARQESGQLRFIQVPSQQTVADDSSLLIPLSSVTTQYYGTSPANISRYDRNKEVRISANLKDLSLSEFSKAFYPQLETLTLPVGVQIDSAGEATEMDKSTNDVIIVLILSVSFIFMILAAQFESWSEPFTIMAALPLSLIGALVGLLITGSSLNMMSSIGILLLMGLVTKNAILLIDFAKQCIAEGIDCDEALIAAGKTRFRPIIMTTLAMMGGMLPIIFSSGSGAEARAPMAYAILGGLLTSTLLTLVVIPCLYSLLYNWKAKRTLFSAIHK